MIGVQFEKLKFDSSQDSKKHKSQKFENVRGVSLLGDSPYYYMLRIVEDFQN